MCHMFCVLLFFGAVGIMGGSPCPAELVRNVISVMGVKEIIVSVSYTCNFITMAFMLIFLLLLFYSTADPIMFTFYKIIYSCDSAFTH